MGYDEDMDSMRVNDVVVQVVATVMAAGVIALVTQVFGLFRKVDKLDRKMDEVVKYLRNTRRDFVNSHQQFEDGEWHHRRNRNV